MTKEELLSKLKEMAELDGDPEVAHTKADSLLLQFINDEGVTAAFEAIEKWYA